MILTLPNLITDHNNNNNNNNNDKTYKNNQRKMKKGKIYTNYPSGIK